MDETLSSTINEIYQKNKLPPICSKIIFNRLLQVNNKSLISIQLQSIETNQWLYNGWSIICLTLAGIHMIQMETDVVVPTRLIFYKRFVVNIYNCLQKNTVDDLYDGLNNYHPKVKLTTEINPLRFLVTEVMIIIIIFVEKHSLHKK